MQPSFGLVTVVTAQSHRMAEAGGDLWGGPVPVPAQAGPPGLCHLSPWRGPGVLCCSPGWSFPSPPSCPQDPELTIHGLCSLGSCCGLSRAPLLAPVSLAGGIYHQPPPGASWIAELPLQQGSGWFKFPPEISKFTPEAAPACGGSDPLLSPLKHHLSLSCLHS